MRGPMFSHSFLAAIIVAGLLVAPGCSSSPDATSTVDSMGKFGVETAKVNDEIEGTLKALDTLVTTQGKDLKTPFAEYSSKVTALEELFGGGAKPAGKAGPAAGVPPGLPFALHHHMLTQMGIHHIENAKLDELARDKVWTSCTMVLPMLEKGSAGSPIRPVSIGVPAQN